MDNADNDLLISAYLDGELNAEERAHVEQLLATSAEARQLVDELRALRTSLQELPQHTLELEFAQRVLNRAERELNAERIALVSAEADLTEESSVAKPPVITPTAVDRALSDGLRKTPEIAESSEFARHVRRALTNRRGLGWSFVAIAAALVIMVSNRQQPAINQPAAGPEVRDKLVMSPAPTMRGLSTNESRSQPAPAQPSLSDFVADAPTASQPGQVGRGNVAELDAASIMNRAEQQPAPDAGGVKGVFDEPTQRLDDRIATNSRASAVNPTGQTEGLATSGNLVAGNQSSIADREELVFIQVSMSPEAARNGVFEQMLAKNHIALVEAPTNHDTLLRQIEDRVPELREQLEEPPGKETAGDQLRERTEIEKTPLGGLATDKDQRNKYFFKGAGPAASGVELVYVEAAADQINGTLTDLRGTPLEFSVISTEAPQADVALQVATPAREQNSIEPLAQENRGEGARRGGRAAGGGGGMGGGGRGGFGGGGLGGSSFGNGTFGRGRATNQFGAQDPPATNLGTDANAKDAELKKADESVDRKATEAEKAKVAGDASSNSGVDQFGVQQKPQELPSLNQPTSATGYAERLSLLELRRRLARGTESAKPTDDLAAQSNPRPKAETSDEKSARRYNSADANYLRQKQAGGAPAAQPASPPARANASNSASAAAPAENKAAMSRAANGNAANLPRQEFSLDGLNGDLSENKLGAISTGAAGAIEKDRRPANGPAAVSNERRRALFVLRVIEPPMAAKPAPEASAPAPGSARP